MGPWFTGPNVILTLKVAVIAVTVLLLISLTLLLFRQYRWHGRVNVVFFVLTFIAVLGLEGIIRFVDPKLFEYFSPETRRIMTIHLCFSIPSMILLPVMLLSGMRRRRTFHIWTGSLFLACWTGTFVTGVFFLPHR